MERNELNISHIDDYMHHLLFGEKKLGEYLYFGNYPTSNPSDSETYIVIEYNNAIDMNVFGRVTALVHLVAKDLASGAKNTPILSEMEIRLNDILDNEYRTNPKMQLRRRSTYQKYDSTRSVHATIVEITMVIK